MSITFRPMPSALALAIITSLSSQAIAQSENKAALETIEVTSQKRVENVQEVPIAISAFSEAAIEKLGADTLNDLGRFTPGLETNNTTATQTTWTIRGITTNDFGIGLDPAVAVYLDGVYVGRRGTSNLNFNDVERVEVLKGPQGTLFGRNSAAGAVNITTKKATDYPTADLSLTLGNFNKAKLESLVNVPLTDELAFRGSFFNNNRDGYIETVTRDKLGGEHSWGVRGNLFWEPSSDFDATFRFDYSSIDQDSRPAVTLNPAYGPGEPFGYVETDGGDDVYEARDASGMSAELNWYLGDMTLTSITAYREFTRYNGMEDDGSAFDRAYFVSVLDEAQNQLSQELRLTGQTERLKWTLGATYFKENIRQTTQAKFNWQTIDAFALTNGGLNPALIPSTPQGSGMKALFGSLFPQENLLQLSQGTGLTVDQVLDVIVDANYGDPYTESTFNKNEVQSVALYGDMTYSVTDKLDLTLGLRYTKDDKTFDIYSQYQNEIKMPFIGVDNIPIGIVFSNPTNTTQSNDWNKLTPRLVMDYQWTDDLMTYVSYSEGFKAGGFNTLGEAPPVAEETVENTEIGMKSTWFDDRVRLNVSAYQYDYINLQQLELDGPAGSVPTYNLRNVDAEGRGAEVELQWQVTPNFQLSGNYGYLDTEYTNWGLFPWEEQELAQGMMVDNQTGQPISGMPDTQYNIAADYYWDLGAGELAFRLDYAYSGERQQDIDGPSLPVLPYDPATVEGLTPDNHIAAYDLVNMRIGYQPYEGNWRLALYAKNLLDEEYLMQIGGQAMAVGSPIANPGLPRMVGVQFNYRFE